MTTLVDTIIAEIIAQWSNPSGVTIMSVINLKDESREANLPENIGVETFIEKEPVAVLSGANFIRDTPFRIVIDSDTEATRDIMVTEVKSIIRSKVISGGWWQILSNLEDENMRDYHAILRGKEVKWV
jgi:hypothetical protein